MKTDTKTIQRVVREEMTKREAEILAAEKANKTESKWSIMWPSKTNFLASFIAVSVVSVLRVLFGYGELESTYLIVSLVVHTYSIAVVFEIIDYFTENKKERK